jgi:hypothetical protein
MYGLLEGVIIWRYIIVRYFMIWSAGYWLLFLGIQVIYFGYVDLSVATPKSDVVALM